MLENRIKKADDMYDTFKNACFGDRLARCRAIQGKSQEDIAIEIILQQHYRGFEPLDETVLSICTGIRKKNILFNNVLKSKKSLVFTDNTSDFEKSYYEAMRKIESTRCKYKSWEQKTSINIDFSVRNLNILTSIYNCDYSFLLADEIYPHRTTNQLVEETGLAPYSVEKLIELTQKATQSEKNIYSYMLSAINKIISCENLLNILYRFFNIDFQDKNFKWIYCAEPVFTFGIYFSKIQHELCSLSEEPQKSNTKYPTFTTNTHSNSFGEKLRQLIASSHYTYTQIANEMYDYELSHGYSPPQVPSILRTINNWLQKTSINEDYRVNLRDLKALCNVLHCDYEYLLGNCESFTIPPQKTTQIIGLSEEALNALKTYKEVDDIAFSGLPKSCVSYRLSIFDSLITSDNLLLYLTAYLTDIDLNAFSDELPSDNPILIEYNQSKNRLDIMGETSFFKKSDLREYFLLAILDELFTISEEYRDYYLHLSPIKVKQIIEQIKKEYNKNGKYTKKE